MQVTTTREPRTDGATEEQNPTVGALVAVRGRKWVVGEVDHAAGSTCVTLQSVEDGEYGRTLDVIWEVEPDRLVLPSGSLPDVTGDGFDPPERLAAFLDAVRWSAVTSADVRTLQAPFRSGVAIEDYQLEPVSRASAPRGRTCCSPTTSASARRSRPVWSSRSCCCATGPARIMIVCPAGLTVKWQDEMREKFGLDFRIVDSAAMRAGPPRLRRCTRTRSRSSR